MHLRPSKLIALSFPRGGVVLFNSKSGSEDVIKWTDLAMYQAKEAGGGSVRFFDGKF